MISSLQASVWLIMAIAAVMGLFFKHRFLEILASTYPETWNSLGSPTLFWNNSPQSAFAVERFLWRGRYRALDDQALTQLAGILKMLEVVIAICLVIFTWLIVVRRV